MTSPPADNKPPRPAVRYDFSWRRANLLAGAVLCAVAGAAVAWQSAGRIDIDRRVPVEPLRVEAAARKIDPNTASPALLRQLPGIAAGRAEAIVAYRQSSSATQPFASAADLANVPGIGPGIVAQLEPYLTFAAPAGEHGDTQRRHGTTTPAASAAWRP